MELFRFGPDVEVLEPSELRTLMAEAAAQVGQLYAR
jgi:predicted DNA-binding transcriptional regulator YafY